MGDLFLGLDLGTSSVKIGLFDPAGRLLRLARREYPLRTPHPGWVEQEPEMWWQAASAALREALDGMSVSRVAAIGLSGQAPSQVLVTADGTSLGPAILWSDRRAAAEAAWLARHVSPRHARSWTGTPLIGDVTQPAARLLWLKTHRPDDWRQCTAVVQPKDYIALQLTGRVATDHHSGYGLYNLKTGRYHADFFSTLKLDLDKMPLVLKPVEVVGRVTSAAAAMTGLRTGVPVVIGTIDAWCEIIGCGGVRPGCAVDVSGTSEIVALVTERPAEGEGVFSSPLLEGLHWIGGPMQTGGGTLHWLADSFYQGATDHAQMEAEAATISPGAEALLFLPYLAGERAPHWDSTARGAFVGLTNRHTRAHCARAVYEGVAFAVHDILERSQVVAGLQVESLRVSGGGARSDLWNQIKADVTGLPTEKMAVLDAGCLGAAMLAAVGVGAFDDPAVASEVMVHPVSTRQPDSGRAAQYEALFDAWRLLYPALCPTFLRLEGLQREMEAL